MVLAQGHASVRFNPGVDTIGSVCWARTSDPLIDSQVLHQLGYGVRIYDSCVKRVSTACGLEGGRR